MRLLLIGAEHGLQGHLLTWPVRSADLLRRDCAVNRPFSMKASAASGRWRETDDPPEAPNVYMEKLPDLARGHDLRSANATELQQCCIARHEEVGIAVLGFPEHACVIVVNGRANWSGILDDGQRLALDEVDGFGPDGWGEPDLLSQGFAEFAQDVVAGVDDRTSRSLIFAIVGAEYVLRVLPRGTHQWQRFVRPAELAAAAARAGLQQIDLRGMRYLPLVHRASWCRDTRVNYLATFARGAGRAGPG